MTLASIAYSVITPIYYLSLNRLHNYVDNL